MRIYPLFLLFAFIGHSNGSAVNVGLSAERAGQLAAEFRPAEVDAIFQVDDDLGALEDPARQMASYSTGAFSVFMGFKELELSDTSTHVVVFWRTRFGTFYWLLLRSENGQDFELIQRPDSFYALGGMGRRCWISSADLDGDGIPEVLFMDGNGEIVEKVYVHRWQDGRLQLISPAVINPQESTEPLPTRYTEIDSFNNSVIITDRDDDGVAEIRALPTLLNDVVARNEDGSAEIAPVPVDSTRVFCMRDHRYELCEVAPPDEELHMVAAMALVHPGTISMGELSAPGEGELRLFVSTPTSGRSVDDFDTASFVFKLDDTALVFKKRWSNRKLPDLSFANVYYKGMPFRATRSDTQGHWQVNPSQPAFPAPLEGLAFTFVGPYLELRIARSALAGYLAERARRFFQEHPGRDRAFITFPLAARLEDGTQAAVEAVVCVRTADRS